jgi:hypothetical protein
MSRIQAHLTECAKDTMDHGSQCELISNMEKTGEDVVKSENVIRNIIGDILKGVVKESDATMGEYSLPTDISNYIFTLDDVFTSFLHVTDQFTLRSVIHSVFRTLC